MRPRRELTALVVVAAAMALGGCAAASTNPTPTASATSPIETLCADPRVAACDLSAESITMTVGADVPDDDTRELARDLHDAAEQASSEYGAKLTRESVDQPVLDPEFSTSAPWEITVYPGDLAEVETSLSRVLAVEDVPGTLGIGTASGWPYVTVASIEQFSGVFHAVSALPMFASGGTYSLLSVDEHLRIVHTPRWVDDTLIDEVIAIANDHPDAEVLLEAPVGGSEPPTLYVARLTPDQVTALDSRLSALPSTAPEGVDIEYVLGSLGTDGVTYTSGTIGSAS